MQGDALAGRVRTVNPDICIGAIGSGRGVDRESGAPCHDGAKLPSAHGAIREAIADVDAPALTDRQIVQSGHYQAMAIVECRKPSLAALAIAVLPEERVAIGGTD